MRKPIPRWIRWVGAPVAVVLLGVLAVRLLLPAWSGAVSLTFLVRALTYPEKETTRVEWYDPLEKVSGEPVPWETSSPSPHLVAALTEMSRYAEAHASAALLVYQDGSLIWERYWGGDAGARTNSFSMAKTVLALAVGAALSEGVLNSLDDPISRYLPEWADRPQGTIRLRDLLTMHSGLANPRGESIPSALVRMHLGTDLIPVVLGLRLLKAPGSAYEYNNFNSQLLGLALERASGRRYAHFLSEKLWRKLGTEDAFLWLDRPGGTAKVYCCLFSTPRDWVRVGMLFLNEGKVNGETVIPDSWIRWMRSPSPREPDYGGHLWLAQAEDGDRARDRTEPFVARDMIYLDGRAKQRVYIVPSRKLVIVRVGERARGWDDAYLPNTFIRALESGPRSQGSALEGL